MHPLDVSLDDSIHHTQKRQVARRRSSLDNSCLAACETIRHLIPDQDDYMDYGYGYGDAGGMMSGGGGGGSMGGSGGAGVGGRRSSTGPAAMYARRRLSLNAMVPSGTTTFLANTSAEKRPKLDLDADCHSSEHKKSSTNNNNSSFSESTSTTPTKDVIDESTRCGAIRGFDDDDDDHSESSLESDADSFCDASVQEQANREYLRQDLGASCFWGSSDGCSFVDFDDMNMNHSPTKDRTKCPVSAQIITEGVELD